MARPPLPGLHDVRGLPCLWRCTVPEEWRDFNGHVNVQYYLKLYERGCHRMFEPDGIDDDWLLAHDAGMFDFANHLLYHAEMLVGDEVSTYNRLLARNERRFHGMYFIVNDSRDRLACTVEYLTAGVSLASRRAARFHPVVLGALDRMLREDQARSWQVTPCGAITV